ncbi:HAMP domain-containing protein [Clostridium thailandense]|uniref:HAMP domain-containing protein n=1 Tax=Clostridium thailandense TaxID=2794346 RepID=UPI00398A1145
MKQEQKTNGGHRWKRFSIWINTTYNFAHEISEGNLDVKKIEVYSKDETSVLANAFNKMVDSLRALIGEISSSSKEVSQSSVSLMVNSEQNAKAIELIAATINQVSVGATDQTHSCEKTVIVVSELYGNNKNYK